MKGLVVILAVLGVMNLTSAQEQNEEKRIKELIEQLGADDIKVREKAMDELFGIGGKAKKFLKEAKNHKDSEVRWRVERLLEIIPTRERLGDKFWEKMPDIVKDMAYESDYTKRFGIFRKLWEDEKQRKKLSDQEIGLLAEEIVRNVQEVDGKGLLISYMANNKIKSASGVVAKFLDDKDSNVCASAIWALRELDAKEYAMDILKLLEDGKDKTPAWQAVRWQAVGALDALADKSLLEPIKKILENEKDGYVIQQLRYIIKKLESKKEEKEPEKK